ncbi:pirin family protein [Proteus mirabilis]|nr:pirin family protein [Proteus mirabilis]HEK0678440.1 pirin family protein [Proteus mirabilis]HEK3099622.1 pirin family protein [Proteus mirabilis]HEK3200116.1 pirin family protein [Proteus mirabilis]
MTMRQVKQIYSAPNPHWVGNGFSMSTVFSYKENAEQYSPFLLMDYAEPTLFKPVTNARGVGTHPHRGFETVTIAYQGEVSHHDSTGHADTIAEGDVQWMTAASGILHKEYHSEKMTKEGGMLEVVQLWVNLPSAYKMAQLRYQALKAQDIPHVQLPNAQGYVRVIAGDYANTSGIAMTYSPLNLWDVRLNHAGTSHYAIPEGHNAMLFVVKGAIHLNNSDIVRQHEIAILDTHGDTLTLVSMGDAIVLILTGEPINEPLVGQGPFVMNTQQELLQAFDDYDNGKFGMMD